PHRRKLYVRKSNSLLPDALGVTMGTHGNEYDRHPPKAPDTVASGPEKVDALGRCMDWLTRFLEAGKQMLGITRKACEDAGFSSKTFYRAKGFMKLNEYKAEGFTWIELPS